MSHVTVGLDENNRVNGRITLLKPPGGDSHFLDLISPESEEEKTSSRVTQPPGGASSDIFGTDSSSDAGSEAGETEPQRKPYRMKSSFELGDGQPDRPRIIKKIQKSVNPITGEIIGDDGLPPEPAKPKPIKANRVPPGGHCTPLW